MAGACEAVLVDSVSDSAVFESVEKGEAVWRRNSVCSVQNGV